MPKSNIIKLDNSNPGIKLLCNRDKRLAKVISMVGDITYQPYSDPFSFVVHEIIEQMLSIKAGKKIYSRLMDLCEGTITPEKISKLTDTEIKSIGTANSKVTYIRGFTNAVIAGEVNLNELAELPDEIVFEKLSKIRGIGSWTAKMYLIFVLDRHDILPVEDAAFLQAYKWLYKTKDTTKASIEKKCRKWKPYSSYAARYLYRALDMGLTKNVFHLYK